MPTIFSPLGILSSVSLAGLMMGLETTTLAVFLASEEFMDFLDYPSPLLQGVLAASSPGMAFFGCWLSGYLQDTFGRLSSLRVASLLWCAGTVVSCLAQEYWAIFAGRSVKGLAVGMFSAGLSVYVLEVTPQRMKSRCTNTIQWCLTWGIMIMFYLCFVCDLALDYDTSFRVAWAISGVPGLALFILSWFLPESPKWLASHGHWEVALDNNDKLHLSSRRDVEANAGAALAVVPTAYTGNQLTTDEEGEVETTNEGQEDKLNLDRAHTRSAAERAIDEFAEDGHQTVTYADLFSKSYRSHLFAGILTQSVVQLSGIGVLMYYLVFICEMIGLQDQSKILAASFQYVINVIFTIPALLWLQHMRRKDVLVYGAFSLGVCITAIGILMGVFGHLVAPIGGNESLVWEVTGTAGSLTLALCFLFVGIFASTLSCAAWLYTSEILPREARAKGSAVCMSVSWTLNFILTFLGPLSLSTITWGTFIIFGVCCFAGALTMGLWFPETFGVDENDIKRIFLSSDSGDQEMEEVISEKKSVTTTSASTRAGISMVPSSYDEKLSITGRAPRSTRSTMRESPSIRSFASSASPARRHSPPARQLHQYQQEVNNSNTKNSLQLTVDGNLRLAPPKSSSTAEPSSGVMLDQKPFTGQSSPFLKVKGAPFEQSDESDGEGEMEKGKDEKKKEEAEDGSESESASGYYNVEPGESPFLGIYL